jgi:hypothetical protein
LGQTPALPSTNPTPAGLIKLNGDDEKRSGQLDKQVIKGVAADGRDVASAPAEAPTAMVKGLGATNVSI